MTMNRREALQLAASAALLPMMPSVPIPAEKVTISCLIKWPNTACEGPVTFAETIFSSHPLNYWPIGHCVESAVGGTALVCGEGKEL